MCRTRTRTRTRTLAADMSGLASCFVLAAAPELRSLTKLPWPAFSGMDDGDGWRAPAAAAPLPGIPRVGQIWNRKSSAAKHAAQLSSLRGWGASLKLGHVSRPSSSLAI